MNKKKTINTPISMLKRIENKLEYLRIDSHSLSLFRIVLGFSILYSLVLVRLPYAVEIWGSNTLIPLDVIKALNRQNSFSIFDYVRNDVFAIAYLYFSILVVCLFIIGFYTKYVSVLLLFLFWNLLQANSAFSFGFDFYTFQLLFWSIFFPLDNHFSVKKSAPQKVSLSFSIAILIQIAWIYFATGVSKYGLSWVGGYAIRNMLLDIWSVKPMANFVVDKAFLYKPLTYISLTMEYLTPIFIFIKFKHVLFRYILVIFLLGFHFFIFMMYDVANFSFSGLSVALILLPSHFWNSIMNKSKDVFIKKNEINKSITYIKYAFVVFAIYVITIENIKYFAKNSNLKNKPSADFITNNLSKIDIPSPIKTSFFLQYWKMFAPNPPSKGGWLTLEYLNAKDGYTYDFFTDNLVVETFQKPQKVFYGMEYFLLNYSRTYVYKEEGLRFRIFLQNWIPYIVKKNGGDFESIKDNLYFVDYAYEITDQSKPFTPNLQKIVIPVNLLLIGEFGKLIE